MRLTKRTPEETEIEFRTQAGERRVPMTSIAKARLVLTDALLNARGGTKHRGRQANAIRIGKLFRDFACGKKVHRSPEIKHETGLAS